MELDVQECQCYALGLNYIVWQYRKSPEGVFIVHVGGPSRRKLYVMGQELFKGPWKDKELYFCNQDKTYWSKHSKLDGRFSNGTEVYRYTGGDR